MINPVPVMTMLMKLKQMITPEVKKLFQKSLQEKLDEDQRKPILLLRSFKRDNYEVEYDFGCGRITLEEKLVNVLGEIGPVLAAGSSRDILKSSVKASDCYNSKIYGDIIKELKNIDSIFISYLIDNILESEIILRPAGAAREYYDDNYWKDNIIKLMEISRFYVCILDFTDSLEWELDFIKNNNSLHKLVIFFPHRLLWGDELQLWIDSYDMLQKKLSFLPLFEHSALGVYFNKYEVSFLIKKEANSQLTDIEVMGKFLQQTFGK